MSPGDFYDMSHVVRYIYFLISCTIHAEDIGCLGVSNYSASVTLKTHLSISQCPKSFILQKKIAETAIYFNIFLHILFHKAK
jgi:hypothetical protein